MKEDKFYFYWRKGIKHMESFIKKQTRYEYLRDKYDDCMFVSQHCSEDMKQIWLNHAKKLLYIINNSTLEELAKPVNL
jgi:hypothetical protein